MYDSIFSILLSSLHRLCERSAAIHACAKHAVVLGGESPLHAVKIGSASLGKGVHCEVESEGSR